MSNWLKRVRPKHRKRGKWERRQQAVIDMELFSRSRMTLQKRRKGLKERGLYRMLIEVCGKCGRKFKMDRTLRNWCDKNDKIKKCPICDNSGRMYLLVGKKEERAIRNLHKAQGCTVRKMTEEEKKKYNVKH